LSGREALVVIAREREEEENEVRNLLIDVRKPESIYQYLRSAFLKMVLWRRVEGGREEQVRD